MNVNGGMKRKKGVSFVEDVLIVTHQSRQQTRQMPCEGEKAAAEKSSSPRSNKATKGYVRKSAANCRRRPSKADDSQGSGIGG